MKVLAIDTSSNVASVALMDEQKLICEYTINHKKTHSQKLMPIIKELVESCEIDVSDIDLFGVSVGPGSFTGLRIGTATAKALAHSWNKPIIGINTLYALAYGAPYFDGIICPIIDAKNNQVYTGKFCWKNNLLEQIGEYCAVNINKLIEEFEDTKVLFLGDGVLVHKEYISGILGSSAFFAPTFCNMQRASTCAELTMLKYKQGSIDDYMTISPFYLKKSEAERNLEGKET